jgi:hypothetical protein
MAAVSGGYFASKSVKIIRARTANFIDLPGPSQAQAEAFRDTWEWGEPARDAYDDVMRANGSPSGGGRLA